MKKTLFIDEYDSNKYIEEYKDFILAKGGDGTLLRAINLFKDKNKPFFGVASGTLNFLMNTENTIQENANYKLFNMIKVKVTFLNKDNVYITNEYQAFNDVMFGGDMNSWIDFNVKDSDSIIGKFKGGGIVIATAQGSTGINRNNGGAILPLSSDHWFITGAFTNRHISVPIEPNDTSITAVSRTPVTVWIDGKNHIIHNVSKIDISQGDKVTIIFNNYTDFKKKRRV